MPHDVPLSTVPLVIKRGLGQIRWTSDLEALKLHNAKKSTCLHLFAEPSTRFREMSSVGNYPINVSQSDSVSRSMPVLLIVDIASREYGLKIVFPSL